MFSKEELTKSDLNKCKDNEDNEDNECLFIKKIDEVGINETSDAAISSAKAADIAEKTAKAANVAEKAAKAAATFYRILIINFYRYNKGNKIVNIPFDIILNTYRNSNVCRGWVENRCKNGINCPYGFHIICSKFKNGICECGGYQALRCPYGAHVNSNGDNKKYETNSVDKYLELLKIKNNK